MASTFGDTVALGHWHIPGEEVENDKERLRRQSGTRCVLLEKVKCMLPKMVPAEASKKEELHRRLRRMQKEKGDLQGQCLGERFGGTGQRTLWGTGQIFTDYRLPQESFCDS
jgi:hypothetical protein